jgi:predicted restriction endonuclease
MCYSVFDEGLLRITLTYQILASEYLEAADNLPGYLTGLEGRTVVLPSESAYWPDTESLKWHGEHVSHHV